MATLADEVRTLSGRATLPWGDDGGVLSMDAVRKLARQHGVSGRIVEIEALKQGVSPLRYLRNQQAISGSEQIRLLESRVGQVGLGGLGGTLLEQFLRAGVGTVRCADGDAFEESNLNRQALSSPDNLGQTKADAARERAMAINPSVDMEPVETFLTPDTLPEFLNGCDVAVDALGGLETRLHLQQAAAEAGLPLVTGALAGWSGYVGVVMPGDTGPADIMGRDNGAEETLGCPAPSVAFFASLMATETLKLITIGRSPLAGKMLVVDMQTMTFETVIIGKSVSYP
ncbi:HesA/MoeB/ThiF family protein [Pseudodesulfovibrio portus]|uniref:Thiazole biosynthesis protein ThiF n=1 Tax=Pseudodesulfovibrio portus TaxID=231439 RepID=A0ABM8AND0_9BACT|nr:HesA/MoeB/ThiF family protein [Pseudodesulfovibrio portus]BDQ32912.1 thiazole biosynthesis protein ThiF [Pseudodesulfovibrio portus]